MDRERPGLSSAPRRKRRLQDLGLPRNLSPHTGWVGPQTAALTLTLRHLKTAGNLFLVRSYLKRWGSLEGGEGAAVLPWGWPQDSAAGAPPHREVRVGVWNTLDRAHTQRCNSPGLVLEEQHPAPSTPAQAGRPQVRRNQVRAWTQPIAAGPPLRGRRQKSKVQELWESGGVCPASRPGPRGVPLPRAPLRTSLGPLTRPIARSPANEEVGSAGRKLSRVQCLRQIVRF